MKIDKNGISKSDHKEAIKILNKLRGGGRVFGNPGEGLKQTLKNMETNNKDENNPFGYKLIDRELKSNISKLKAGIKGEETLANYFEKIIKHSEELDGLVVFASLAYEPDESLDYTPDTDFVAIYGKHILVLDAKNVVTNKELPIYMNGNEICTPRGVLLEVKPSTFIWKKIFVNNGIDFDSISGCSVLINQNGATIFKNHQWHKSEAKPVHISDLYEFLLDWIKDKDNTLSLNMVTKIAQTQIRKESSGIEWGTAYNKFKI